MFPLEGQAMSYNPFIMFWGVGSSLLHTTGRQRYLEKPNFGKRVLVNRGLEVG